MFRKLSSLLIGTVLIGGVSASQNPGLYLEQKDGTRIQLDPNQLIFVNSHGNEIKLNNDFVQQAFADRRNSVETLSASNESGEHHIEDILFSEGSLEIYNEIKSEISTHELNDLRDSVISLLNIEKIDKNVFKQVISYYEFTEHNIIMAKLWLDIALKCYPKAIDDETHGRVDALYNNHLNNELS